jgi:hypothetical protein
VRVLRETPQRGQRSPSTLQALLLADRTSFHPNGTTIAVPEGATGPIPANSESLRKARLGRDISTASYPQRPSYRRGSARPAEDGCLSPPSLSTPASRGRRPR